MSVVDCGSPVLDGDAGDAQCPEAGFVNLGDWDSVGGR